jgi:hypothetical protein
MLCSVELLWTFISFFSRNDLLSFSFFLKKNLKQHHVKIQEKVVHVRTKVVGPSASGSYVHQTAFYVKVKGLEVPHTPSLRPCLDPLSLLETGF